MSLVATQVVGEVSAKAEAAVANAVFVMKGTAKNTVLTATAGAKILGISTSITAINQGNPRAICGIAKLWVSGSITAGERLKATTNGYGLAVTTDLDEYGAVALEDGEDCIIAVQVELGIYGV